MTACLTSPSHGPATAMGVCSKCAEWLNKARCVSRWFIRTQSKPLDVDLRALRERFVSVKAFGGGKVREK